MTRFADPDLAWRLDLGLRLRGNREAMALVDRCLSIVARAETADPVMLRTLQGEIEGLADDLALRFGAPAGSRRPESPSVSD